MGLSPEPIEYLAGQIGFKTISLRHIGPTMALKMNGGTTIAGAIILAHMADTPVFGTGGLAGVHRDEHVTINVSAGLTGLARTPFAVVCSGPKLLVSAVSDDIAGKSDLEHLRQTGLDRSRIAVF